MFGRSQQRLKLFGIGCGQKGDLLIEEHQEFVASVQAAGLLYSAPSLSAFDEAHFHGFGFLLDGDFYITAKGIAAIALASDLLALALMTVLLCLVISLRMSLTLRLRTLRAVDMTVPLPRIRFALQRILCSAGIGPASTQKISMTGKIESNDLTKNAQILLAALKKAGVDLSDERGTAGKLWRALAAGARGGLTTEFLSEIQARGEMVAEIEAARARFDATGNQNPADLGFLLLGLFCMSTTDSFEVANDILALLRAKKAGRAVPNEEDERATRIGYLDLSTDRKMRG